ncbi:MAG: hypothetical protein ACKPKQ_19405, partial [Dolichospermum sp.]
FIEGIINIISQTTEIQKQQFEARKQQIDYENNIQDIKLQASELQRSLPGKIIPIDSSLTDEFNLGLKNINTTVNTINTSIGKVTNSLSNEVVDAAKKANSELDKLNQTVNSLDNNSKSWIESFRSNFTNLFKAFENGFSNAIIITNAQIKTSNWIESFRSNFTDLFKVFENGFSNLGNAITNVQIKTSNWIESFRSNSTNLFKAFENGFSNAITNAQIKTSNWIESFRSNFTNLFKAFENGFSNLGNAITTNLFKVFENGFGNLRNAVTDARIKTSSWIASMATGQGAIENSAGQQSEQGAGKAFANLIGFLKKVYKVDESVIPNTMPVVKGKVGFVENSRSSMDSYPGHIGDDIFAPIGSRVFAPLPGTVVQSREGGTRNTDDANPLVPGYQPQQLVIIKLDMPIEFEGRKITHLNMRHLLSRNVEVGQKVEMGDLLGTIGEAGGRGTQFGTKNPGTPGDADAAHLHIEYSPAENNQRDSLPDAIASRLTAKLSQAFSAAQLPVPATRQRQPVPAMSVPQPTQTTKQKQQEYKNEQNLWQRFTNWLIPKAGAAEMPQQKTNTGVNFRKTSDVYKLNIDPKKTRLEFSKGWDQESKAYKDNNALG